MKKLLIAALLTLALLLGGCAAERTEDMETPKNTVTVINGMNDADIWLLPDTAENRKTTMWGAATVRAESNCTVTAELGEAGDGGLYLFRMIDSDGFYYSANELRLEPGCTLRIYGEDIMSPSLEVARADGSAKNTYKLFAARL